MATNTPKDAAFAKKLTNLIQDFMPCPEGKRFTAEGNKLALDIAMKCAPVLKAEFAEIKRSMADAAAQKVGA